MFSNPHLIKLMVEDGLAAPTVRAMAWSWVLGKLAPRPPDSTSGYQEEFTFMRLSR
jgi:hypothetical protein